MMLSRSDKFSALAGRILDGLTPEEGQLALLHVGGRLVDGIFNAHQREGVEPSPLQDLYYREALRVFSDSPSVEARVRLLRALERNITPTVRRHHAWRHERNANVVWEFSGPTGTGKSSAALHLLETLNNVAPAELERHVTIDVPELPTILPRLSSGSGVLVDEQTQTTGEGSITQAKVLRSMEDQIRLSGIDIYWSSPESEDHATSQGEFVAYAANPTGRYTRFILYLHDLPLGYVNIPWCSDPMWDAYAPIKRRNVERALRAAFHNASIMDEHIKRFFAHEGVQAACRVRRLKIADWKRLLKRFSVALNTTQIQALAEEIEFIFETLLHRPEDFPTIYGWEPSEAMMRAAEENATGGTRAQDR